LSTGA